MNEEKVLGRPCRMAGMSHIYIIDSLWYTHSLYPNIYGSTGDFDFVTIGIIKTYDTITNEYKTYIGVGKGDDMEMDEDRIAGCGTSFTNPVSFDDMKTWLKMKEK